MQQACAQKIASIETAMCKSLSPSQCATLTPDLDNYFVADFDTGHEKITKKFHGLSLCINWIARMESKRISGQLRKEGLHKTDKKDASSEAPRKGKTHVICVAYRIFGIFHVYIYIGVFNACIVTPIYTCIRTKVFVF